jgi:magnesium transporter
VATPAHLTGTRPGDQGGGERDPRLPRSYYLDERGVLQRNLQPSELLAAVQCGRGELWVEVDVAVRSQIAVLEKVFHFHPLSIEDTLNPSSRVKIEEYPGYLFMVIRGVRFDDATHDPYDLETFNLCLFIGPHYVVTAHAGRAEAVATVADRLERSPDLMGRGVERLAHAVMDATVDEYFPILDRIDEFISGIEDRVFANFDEKALHEIFAVKRLVLGLRRHLVPQREVFNVLTNRPTALITPEVQLYFRDIYDHQLRIAESLETYRDLLSSTLDSYLTQVSNRLGAVTKGLSVVATLSIPFVVISGMWGMNFDRIPLSKDPLGFWWMLIVQLVIGFGLIGILRWRKLL